VPGRSSESAQEPGRVDVHELRNALGSTMLSLTAARHALQSDDRQHASVCLDDAQAACDECRRLLTGVDPWPARVGSSDGDPAAPVG
jgi:hypothetical protein